MEMIQFVWESFLRAVIRFWDNRFIPEESPSELYHEEVIYLRARNEELQQFILERLNPIPVSVIEPEQKEAFEQFGRPIETTSQKRRRLEQESLANWNKLVQEAREEKLKQANTKTTEELEADLLGVEN